MTALTERAPVHRECTTPACDTEIVRYGEGAVTHCTPCAERLFPNRRPLTVPAGAVEERQ